MREKLLEKIMAGKPDKAKASIEMPSKDNQKYK